MTHPETVAIPDGSRRAPIAQTRDEVASRPCTNVLHLLPNLNVGGGQYYVLRHLAEFNRERVASFLCTVLPGDEHDTVEPLFRQSGAKILHLYHRHVWQFPRNLWKLIRFIRAEHIDLIHTNGTPS